MCHLAILDGKVVVGECVWRVAPAACAQVRIPLVQEEIDKEPGKMDKQRTKGPKIELAEKVKEKVAASAKRKAAKKKLEKETKKPIKQKIIKKKAVKKKVTKKKPVKKTKSIGSKSKISASSSKNRERKKK